jgi:hypothetical protein
MSAPFPIRTPLEDLLSEFIGATEQLRTAHSGLSRSECLDLLDALYWYYWRCFYPSPYYSCLRRRRPRLTPTRRQQIDRGTEHEHTDLFALPRAFE